MKAPQPVAAPPDNKPPDGELSMKDLWADAAKAFEKICGESLQKGEVKNFDDVQRKIEASTKASYDLDPAPEDKWDKAKSVGLKSLKYLKMLVGAASMASDFIPIPGAAANITATALSFVFDIPETIKGYNDAVDQVFTEVSSALAQFKIYSSMEKVDPLLIKQIHLVLVSFVKVCAHVVQYRQSRKRDRFLRHIKVILDDSSPLSGEMAEFKRVLQQQRDVEGTLTLSVVVETKQDVAKLLEQSIFFGKLTEETHQAVQSLKDDADRLKRLMKIREALGVSPSVRLESNTTEACTKIADKCLAGTGSWIWTHDAFKTWTSHDEKDKDASRVLLVSGPSSSGKTSASALIAKRLEEQKGRSYVANYFFSNKKADEDGDKNPNPIQSALKDMAFQIARVDVTVSKALSKACDAEPSAFRRSTSLENLDGLWKELKIGTTGSGATYYLVFDGLDNLPSKQTEMLLKFIVRLTGESSGRIHVLASGTDERFSNEPAFQDVLRIRMEEQNRPDMSILIDEELNKQGVLQNTKPDSDQKKARDKIIEKLPQNVAGSYSKLKFGLDDVVRLLSTRAAARELDQMLDQSMSSHEAAIKNLQRTLTAEEISELNELLKWVLFCNETMSLEELEAVMYLFSGIESLASLESIIKNKYSAVLKIQDDLVQGEDGIKEHLQKEKDNSGRSLHSKDRSTISMSITVTNVDEELCGHFLWDLAHKAIRDKFKFNFDGDGVSALHSSSQGVIAVDEFEAHHTILQRTFDYLKKDPKEQSDKIAKYLVMWLPYHLDRLSVLEDEEKGELMPNEKFDIGQDLYDLFKNDSTFRRHKATFEQSYWSALEIIDIQKWLTDTAVVRKVDKNWRDRVRTAETPAQGFLKELVKVVVRGLLRERTWTMKGAWYWIEEFMRVEKKENQQETQPSDANAEAENANNDGTNDENDAGGEAEVELPYTVDWHAVSSWCQTFLELPDSELDSLWYERLGEVSYSQTESMTDTTIGFYKQAIEKGNPSWLCHRGLAIIYYDQFQLPEAIEQLELAIKAAQREDATPKAEPKDIVDLQLRLGAYAYKAREIPKALEYFLLVCKNGDEKQTIEGLFGQIRALLSSPDSEAAEKLVREIFGPGSDEGKMVDLVKLVALDTEHNEVVIRLFSLAEKDPSLLRAIVHSMELATARAPLDEVPTATATEVGEDILEDAARAVLLYHRGIAAYTYKIVSGGTDPVTESLRLWKQSSEELAHFNSQVSFMTKQLADGALTKYYFENMIEGCHLNYLEDIVKLADSNYHLLFNEPVGFQAAVLAINGKKDDARDALMKKMELALQILSDDTPDNDYFGFTKVMELLGHYQDFDNTAIALSMLMCPDLVTEALCFTESDVTDGDEAKTVLEKVQNMGKEILVAVKTKFPDPSQQIQRIEAAKAYVDSLVATDKNESEGNDTKPNELDPITASAHRLLQSRISELHQKNTPEVNMDGIPTWTCNGRTANGKPCENLTSFENEFYHCIYCDNIDFCHGCLKKLKDPNASPQLTGCSAKHRWIQIPQQGADTHVGPKAQKVRVPMGIEAVDGDEQIIRARYSENSVGDEITLEAWLQKLAREWGISLDEIKDRASRENTPEVNGEGEKATEEAKEEPTEVAD